LTFEPTCDLYDEFGDKAHVPEVQWKSYGGGANKFCGYVVTVKCFEDNSWVKEMVEQTIGQNKVLVVDGGGSTRCALMGDRLATASCDRQQVDRHCYLRQCAGVVLTVRCFN
jgi:regulator of ribonuclease activity A